MKLTMLSGIPYLTAHQIEMVITVVRNTHYFQIVLGTWNARPVAEKTWAIFKNRFKATQIELKAIRGPAIQHAGFHHDNCLATHLRYYLSSQNTEIHAMLHVMTVDTIATKNGTTPPSYTYK